MRKSGSGSSEDMLPLDPVTVLLSIITFIFLTTVIYKKKEHVHLNYPPGPKPWPIIGNIPILDVQKPYLSFQELAKTYGPVFSITIGVQKMVVLCGYDVVKEALVNHAEYFSDRPNVPAFTDYSKGYGIGLSNGHNWKAMKKFTLSKFRDFGVGKRIMEDKINEEANCLVQTFKSYKGKPFDNTMLVYSAFCNIIVSIVFGHRFDSDDPELERLLILVMNITSSLGSPISLLYNAYPSLLRWFPGSHKTILKITDELHSIIKDMVMKLRNELDVNNPRTFIDCFLVKQKEEKPDPEFYFHDESLTSLVSDLLNAGIETSASTMRWALLLMMKYPEIQKNVKKEIEKVIGSSEPQMAHRKHMPYTDAVIHELQRFANVVPTNLPHMTTEDVTLKGFFLPKGTHVMPSLTSVLRDDKHFKKPDEFYPQHFLDSDGNFVKNEAFIPFSAGKRMCAGESLAKVELFLVFTKLLQNFTFTAPPGAKLDLTGTVGFISHPKKHEICAISQN
ncbi:cytochrome P450 2C5-like [Ranitomeya variabilis]|uniref:cytochrome P450 2C5-like n=1 Tax=Ranitomeya variabilis TaxID=490064 RepID=UPI004057C9B2